LGVRVRFKVWVAGWLALWVCLAAAAVEPPAAAPATDLRVLIDVSGSMRHNDPDNLRRPALRLLVNLLPAGSRAGVWTFARYVNMAVPLGTVNPAWRARAKAESARIGSPGQYTDIETAIRRATLDWKTPATGVHRTLILLTDGMVDLGKDPARNAASRERILHDLLPRLQRAGVTVHTVALSDGADQKLLSALALGTDGWFEKARDAQTLQRIFMRLFQQSVPTEALPLRDNHFSVDAGVQDMTVVVFRDKGAAATRLSGPGGQSFDADHHPKAVRWHHDTGYDMVTIAHPAQGGWRIQAAADPDNRVLVVTNLRLQTDPLPGNVLMGEQMAVHAWLSRKDKIETDADFLKLAHFTARDGEGMPTPLHDDGKGADAAAGDGRYTVTLTRALQAGGHELVVTARGPTFERQWRHAFQVHTRPAELSVQRLDGVAGGFRLTATPQPELLDLGSLKLTAVVEGAETAVHLLARGADGHWSVDLPAADAGKVVSVELSGRSSNGRALTAALDETLPPAEVPAKAPAEVATVAPIEVPAKAAAPLAEVKAASPAPVEKPVDWLVVTLVVLLTNLVAVGLGAAGYFLWKRRARRRAASEPVDEEDDDGQ
jgi:uncharacterized protein (TIGR03503 family)